MKISIIIPSYNEIDNIEKLLNSIVQINNDFKVFIIDDSNDNAIANIANKFHQVNYTYRGKKLGRGSAVIDGMKKVLDEKLADIIIEMDADFSHDPQELISNLNKFKKEKLDLLVSSRYKTDSQIINWSLRRRIFSKLSNKLARFLLKVPLSDYTNGYRIYSNRATKHVLSQCGKIGDGFIVLSEILVQLHYSGFKINETSTIFRNRVRGVSSVTLSEVIKSLFGLYKIWKIKRILEK
jgi:dolichol-phosphate mannosyltransferase